MDLRCVSSWFQLELCIRSSFYLRAFACAQYAFAVLQCGQSTKRSITEKMRNVNINRANFFVAQRHNST